MWAAIVERLAVHLAVPGICEECAQPIPAADIDAFQAEGGDSFPACCENCAEVG